MGIKQKNVRHRAEDHRALDVEDGVPPPRAAPALLRRVVLSCASSTHRPHAAPPQGWAAGYDSSLSRRRNHDSELSSITPRQTTGAQGHLRSNKKMVDAPPSPTRGGQEYSAGQQSKSHSSPMGHQPWASSWDSSLCRKWEGDIAPGRKYTSNVAALIHGGD